MQLERRRDLANGRQGRFRAPSRLGFDLPAQAKSDKSQGVRGTESPDSINQTLKKTEKHVSVFSGEVQCDGGAQHCGGFAQKALALVRGKVFGFADGFMMMGVAFLLERSGVVVNSQTVADQDAAEIFSENVVEQITST